MAHATLAQSGPGADKAVLLESVLEDSGFWDCLDAVRASRRSDPADFKILIKPDLAVFVRDSCAGTDRELVEHLIDLLSRRSYHLVAVGATRDEFDLWLDNRDVLVLADCLGFRGRTGRGNNYDIVDLSERLSASAFPQSSVLHGSCLGEDWINAGFRICFAKNKTHEEYYYSLCLNGLLELLPLRDKNYHYHHRLMAGELCLDILRSHGPDFALIDAYVSCDGPGGTRAPSARPTHAIIASQNALLADWVGAMKMGLDPYVSPINGYSLRQESLPTGYAIKGDLTPYPGWRNVSRGQAEAVARRNASVFACRAATALTQVVNQEMFPFKDVLLGRANALVTGWLAKFEATSLGSWLLIALNQAVGAVFDYTEAARIVLAKDAVHRRDQSLNVDLRLFPEADFAAIADYLDPLARLVRQTPERFGFRWRYLDGSVLFEFSRVIPVPFDTFVDRVDISRSIQFMNDYIGGCAVDLERDSRDRVLRQVERNLYLPQPNWVAFYRRDPIDVTKLESVSYTHDSQVIYWRTVKSENASARYDDGSVTFSRTREDETLVTIFGRQEFTLPPLLQLVDRQLPPSIKDRLVAQAYAVFFRRTLANFEARFEGRDIRVGRDWDPREGEDGQSPVTPIPYQVVVDRLSTLLEKLRDGATRLDQSTSDDRARADTLGVPDARGFRHFSAPVRSSVAAAPSGLFGLESEVGSFLERLVADGTHLVSDLARAMYKDIWSSWEQGAAIGPKGIP